MELPDVRGVFPRADEKPVVFVGCDASYAARHAVPLLYSLDSTRSDVDAHLHVVNLRGEVEAALAAVASDLRATAVTLSWETIDLSRYDDHRKATYYACVRFVRAVQLMLACDRPVLVLDADSLVRKEIRLPRGRQAGLFLRRDHPRHMGVPAGAVLFTPEGRDFALAVASSIGRTLAEWLDGRRDIGWYLDQYALAETYAALQPDTHDFDRTFMDWTFADDSVVWTGKGRRKHDSAAYGAERDRYAARHSGMQIRARRWRPGGRPRAIILQPCLDLPFKRPQGCVQRGDGLGELRRHWATFLANVRSALIQAGWDVALVERPNWELTPELADTWRADVAFVPHRERHQFASRTPALFYMQTAIPHLFTVDRQGWGAGHSGYPFDHTSADPNGSAFDELRERLDSNASKFDQPCRRRRERLIADGLIPDAPYIFVPCQIPHDQTITLHSQTDEAELVAALTAWATSEDVHVVLKEHPANPASMRRLRAAARDSRLVHWVGHDRASIHDLIANSTAVYTINSGAGLEALLHGKPVVTFGDSEYRGVTIAWTGLENLSNAWCMARRWSPSDHMREYRRFFDWFVGRHALDSRDVDSRRLMAKVEAVSGETAKAA